MSAQPANCRSCEAPLPEGASFCPSCGAAVESGSTVRADVPPHETSAAPVTVRHSSPRWFGVTPPTTLLVVAAGALVLGLVLLITGSVVAGLLLVGLALLLAAAVLEVARRKPDTVAVRRAARGAESLRARAGVAVQALRTRSNARRAITQRRAEALRLESERGLLLRRLGEAAYRGQDWGHIRLELEALDARVAALEAEAGQIAAAAAEEVERASRTVQPTEVRPPEGGEQHTA